MRLTTRLISPATSLHTKLMLTLSILVTLAVACVAYVLLEHGRETRFMELEGRADRLTDLASHSVAYSVWNVDLAAIDEQLASLASDPEVAEFSITAVGYGKLREVIKPLGPLVDPIVRIQAINFFTAETGSQKIGEVRVVLTRALVEQAITEAHRAVWVLVVVVLAVLYAVTFVLFRRMVSTPVNRLEAMVDRIALGDLDARCTVESGDELGRLAVRVNTMADRLCESDGSLRDSETRLQLVLDGSQLGYWDWDIETDEVTRNTRWAEMLGYTLEEVEYTVKQWTDLHHPDDRTLALKSINDHLEGRTPAHEIEYRMRTKDGQYKWILDQAKLVSWDAQGKPMRMCGTHRDITERKLAEQEREKLQNQLTQAQKMESIGTLAGGIAHDFNNILSAVIGFTELALDAVEKDTPIAEDLLEVYTAGLRAKDLVQQILTFARQTEKTLKPIQVNLIIKEVLKFIRSSIPTTIEIKQNINSESFIMASSTQVHQIMMNLCTNAAQAMEDDGGILEITLKDINIDKAKMRENFHLKCGNYIEIKVSDTGDGIEPHIIDKIFEPYFTTKGPGEGTGMGLAMVYGIVETYGGEISVESKQAKGTVFTIYLPTAKRKNALLTDKSTDLPTGQERILFVDDEVPITKMASRILGQLGYSVTTKTNSLEALELFRSKPNDFDLVISDVAMPKMSGDQLSKKLIEIRPDFPVILSTGYSKQISEKEAFNLGVKAFTYKPIVKEDLATTVRKVLDEAKN